MSAEKQNAVADVDQTSSVVAALGVLGGGDDDVHFASSVGEKRAGVTCRRRTMLMSGDVVDA